MPRCLFVEAMVAFGEAYFALQNASVQHRFNPFVSVAVRIWDISTFVYIRNVTPKGVNSGVGMAMQVLSYDICVI